MDFETLYCPDYKSKFCLPVRYVTIIVISAISLFQCRNFQHPDHSLTTKGQINILDSIKIISNDRIRFLSYASDFKKSIFLEENYNKLIVYDHVVDHQYRLLNDIDEFYIDGDILSASIRKKILFIITTNGYLAWDIEKGIALMHEKTMMGRVIPRTELLSFVSDSTIISNLIPYDHAVEPSSSYPIFAEYNVNGKFQTIGILPTYKFEGSRVLLNFVSETKSVDCIINPDQSFYTNRLDKIYEGEKLLRFGINIPSMQEHPFSKGESYGLYDSPYIPTIHHIYGDDTFVFVHTVHTLSDRSVPLEEIKYEWSVTVYKRDSLLPIATYDFENGESRICSKVDNDSYLVEHVSDHEGEGFTRYSILEFGIKEEAELN